MAVSVVVNQVCDRCLKPFVEKVLKQGEALPSLHRQTEPLSILRGDKVLARFDDLCPECEGALTNLVGRLRLDPATPVKKSHKKAPAAPTNGNTTAAEVAVVPTPSVTGNITGNVTVKLTPEGVAVVMPESTPPPVAVAPVPAPAHGEPVPPPSPSVDVDDDLF
jgi:hypothetical protein